MNGHTIVQIGMIPTDVSIACHGQPGGQKEISENSDVYRL